MMCLMASPARLYRDRFPCLLGLVVLVAVGSIQQARALVVTEIMYHAEPLDDGPFEFIELHNENPDPFEETFTYGFNRTVIEDSGYLEWRVGAKSRLWSMSYKQCRHVLQLFSRTVCLWFL